MTFITALLKKRFDAELLFTDSDSLACEIKSDVYEEPTHITHKIFGKNYAAIHKIKLVLTCNKPIHVGFTVVELSKWLMYDFHYGFIKKNALMLNCCLLTQTVLFAIQNQMFMKN